MIYAVDKYVDRLFSTAKKETGWNDEDKYHYFDTEQDAKDFIINRALTKVDLAESALRQAQKRYQKCLKKYGNKS